MDTVTETQLETVISVSGKLVNNKIELECAVDDIISMVADKKIVIIRDLFPESSLRELRSEAAAWAEAVQMAEADDFKGNYHMRKAKVSNIQKVPHVFHDFNFNNFDTLPKSLRDKMLLVFDPLRVFYNQLTGYNVPFGYIENAAYLHPQLIQYPVGGGFFGRHNHNLLPQQIGFILSLSRYGTDYKGGGTCFEIKGQQIDMEHVQNIGDLVLWPNDVDHWVKQSPLDDWFSWDTDKGRWVATLAYFNPY